MSEAVVGLHAGLPRATYESWPLPSYSLLKHYERSPAHALEQMRHPKEPTDAMDLGSALHSAVLEPARFIEQWAEAPVCDRRTNIGKQRWSEWEAAHTGVQALKSDEWRAVLAMREVLLAHATAGELLRAPGLREVALVVEPEPGLGLVKGLVDLVVPWAGATCLVELKTARVADGALWCTQAARLQYHAQAALYLDLAAAIAPGPQRRHLTVAVETIAPWGIVIHEWDEQALETGARCWRRWLALHRECEANGRWPGYEPGVHGLRLPRWAVDFTEEENEWTQ